jgi:hypothetical protein
MRIPPFLTGAALTALSAGLALGLSAAPARAGDVTFDFGQLAASPDALCTSNCVLAGTGALTFTTSGISITAQAYSDATSTSLSGAAYLTQKPGAPGAETGLGESDSLTNPSLDYEIAVGKGVVLDNAAAIALGYSPVSITIASLQNGESADVYGGSTPLEMLIGNVTGPPVSQTIALSGSDTFVTVEGVTTGNSVIVSEEFSTPSSQVVPEPGTVALLASSLFGLAVLRRRRMG